MEGSPGGFEKEKCTVTLISGSGAGEMALASPDTSI